jgi:hypothetical protein
MITPDPTPVLVILDQHMEVYEYLLREQQPSFAATLQTTVPKFGLLSAASWLETQVQGALVAFLGEVTGEATHAAIFAENAGIKLRYHTMFDWNRRSANKFFALFGEDFKKFCTDRVKNEPDLDDAIRAFMEVGDLRNQLVHNDFASFHLDKSTDEVRALFELAVGFVETLPALFRDFAVQHQSSPSVSETLASNDDP